MQEDLNKLNSDIQKLIVNFAEEHGITPIVRTEVTNDGRLEIVCIIEQTITSRNNLR